jgi:hypothetical protein
MLCCSYILTLTTTGSSWGAHGFEPFMPYCGSTSILISALTNPCAITTTDPWLVLDNKLVFPRSSWRYVGNDGIFMSLLSLTAGVFHGLIKLHIVLYIYINIYSVTMSFYILKDIYFGDDPTFTNFRFVNRGDVNRGTIENRIPAPIPSYRIGNLTV